jgi:hypothetical protein
MPRSPCAAEGGQRAHRVAHPKRSRTRAVEEAPLTATRRERPWIEGVLWLAAVALLSPLLIYYPAGVMPLSALFGIAAGIALGLALTGRRLHRSLLDDALSGRDGKGRFLMTFGMALLLLFFVLLGSVVALLLILRQASPTLPV